MPIGSRSAPRRIVPASASVAAVVEPHPRAVDGQPAAQELDRLRRQLGGLGAGERPVAHRGERAQAVVARAALGDVAPDREQQRPALGVARSPSSSRR